MIDSYRHHPPEMLLSNNIISSTPSPGGELVGTLSTLNFTAVLFEVVSQSPPGVGGAGAPPFEIRGSDQLFCIGEGTFQVFHGDVTVDIVAYDVLSHSFGKSFVVTVT